MKTYSPRCRRCPRLVDHLSQLREQYPDYHCRPVSGFGDEQSRLLIVGLAPGMHGANKTGRPFTGDASGELIFKTLHRMGWASDPSCSNYDEEFRLSGCRITNAVKCFPPENKPTGLEINTCNAYLKAEIKAMAGGVILSLGKVAHDAVLKAFGIPLSHLKFAHDASHSLSSQFLLVNSFHCSKYNLQTGRLTPEAFERTLVKAAKMSGNLVKV